MEIVEEIAASVEDAHQFNRELGAFLYKNFIINDKTIADWKRHFHIEIPEEVSFPLLIKKSAEIARKYQEATFFRERQMIQLAILEQAQTSKFNIAYNDAREHHQREFGKPLAAESCKAAASLVIKDIEEAISNQRVVSDFWNKTCLSLIEMRKHLELMGHALAAEARAGRDFVFKGEER
jgi:hypothetical protein